MQLVQYLYVKNNAVVWIDPLGLKYVPLRELAETYGATVEYQKATSYRGARAKVTINGTTKYYSASIADNDKAYLNTAETLMYVDDNQFYQQWGIFTSDTQYGIIDKAEMEALENFEMAPASYTYLMRLTYAWYLADSAEEQATLLQEANWFRGTGYSEIYFDSILCIDEEKFNEYIQYMPTLPTKMISQEEHYFRNVLNIEYNWSSFSKLLELQDAGTLPYAIGWNDGVAATLHQNVTNGGPNQKYVSNDGHFEMIFSANGVLQNETNNSKDMGTYNYFGSEISFWGHALYDVATFYMWQNTYDDYVEFYAPQKW